MISIKIKDPLFTYRARLVNIFDFNPKKLSIEKVCAINDEKEYIYYIKYGGDPFYLVIDDLKGYFKYFKEKDTTELSSLEHRKELEFIIKDQKQAKIYNQIWNKIKELINSVDGVNFGFSDYFRDHGVIIFDTDDTLPLDDTVTIYSITIIIRSVYRDYYDRFYPQIHLENCIYKKMLEYDKIDISEGIDIKKCKETSRECNLCKFYYFLDQSFNYGPYLCNGCYDMSLKAVSIKNLTIINHNENHYRVNFAFISKKDVYNLIKNATIIDKKGTL